MNLIRFVRGIGYEPVLAGNIKGLLDHSRTPETQAAFAAQHSQSPKMATSFADGTKIAMEMAVVANATGFGVGQRGMFGPECRHVSEALKAFDLESLRSQCIVDYILGAEPGSGIFVIGFNEHPMRRHYANYYKMGEGPFYMFYTPYHLPHLEIPLTAARAALFHDSAVVPLKGLVCDVISIAKSDLKAGDVLDGIGGFTCYGLLENRETSRADDLLPMGLAQDCRLRRPVAKGQVIHFADVELPSGRLCDRLWHKQAELFEGDAPAGLFEQPRQIAVDTPAPKVMV